jgi:feruloyl esterase
VENDQAPDSVIGTNAASGLSRPLCAYPNVATYDGKGDPASASSFRCVKPHP